MLGHCESWQDTHVASMAYALSPLSTEYPFVALSTLRERAADAAKQLLVVPPFVVSTNPCIAVTSVKLAYDPYQNVVQNAVVPVPIVLRVCELCGGEASGKLALRLPDRALHVQAFVCDGLEDVQEEVPISASHTRGEGVTAAFCVRLLPFQIRCWKLVVSFQASLI